MISLRVLLGMMSLVLLVAACSSSDGLTPDAATSDGALNDLGRHDSRIDGTAPDASDGPTPDGSTDLPVPGDAAPDAKIIPLPRGLKWVRTHEMQLSGLVVSMGSPSASAVNDYFNTFLANTIHLWSDGLPTAMDAWLTHKPGARWISWVNKNGNSAGKPIGGYPAGKPGRVGYQIGDEPSDLAALKVMEAGVKVARAADPDALIFVNFNTSATTQMLDHYLTMDCDVISYDQYTRGPNSYEMRERIRTYGLKKGVPYWRYIKSYLSSDSITESDMRWDAFSGLVYGYTGHSWFVYQVKSPPHLPKPALFAAPDTFSAAKTGLYAVAAKINTELANLGRCVTQLTSTDVRYVSSIPFVQPKQTKAWAAGAGGDPFITAIAPAPNTIGLEISIGFFTDDSGQRYVMVQNTRHTHGSWPINNSSAGTIRITFDLSMATFDKTKLLTLSKATGKQETLPLTSLGGGKAQVDVTLAAGDPMLFKYATGPFVLGP